MLLPEPVTLLIFGTWLAGDAYEDYKWRHPKDPNPPVHYAYDPDYFVLGDEKACGDETNGPCKSGVITSVSTTIDAQDPSLPTMGCVDCNG